MSRPGSVGGLCHNVGRSGYLFSDLRFNGQTLGRELDNVRREHHVSAARLEIDECGNIIDDIDAVGFSH